jgi:hypothetical protein
MSQALRASIPGAFQRTLPLVCLTNLNLVAFLVTYIFSSRVTSTSREALLKSLCGLSDEAANKDFPQWTQKDWMAGEALFVSAYNGYRGDLSYTRSCYGF